MTNPNQLLCNVLEECGLSNTADVAAKLIDEEVSWNDITEAHGSRGDIGVHNLLNGIVKTGGCGQTSSSISTKLRDLAL